MEGLTNLEKVYLYRCIVNQLPMETILKLFSLEELKMIEFQISKSISNKTKKELEKGLLSLAAKAGETVLKSIEEAKSFSN